MLSDHIDNAGGIAEMNYLEVRTRTDILDSVGNTSSNWKGFAIASAALTSWLYLQRMFLQELMESIFLKRQFSDVIRGWNDTGSFLGFSHEFCWESSYGYGV
jgi:Na+/H+-translocating membrane pyrophosphatase